ncbi:MAG TPA: iron-sulfur cluster-binding domain-containing protein [Candidatus Sulfotelmatobacter sp.]|nr:iron-sulfur cluster-binding domain-containing protein [Candidatus Sulfotelmatobacter sp.]
MRTTVLALASLFVFLAGFNVWNMLSNRGGSPRGARLWTQIHRIVGYAFITLFIVLCYFMMMRIKGLPDELPARVILHAIMALSLAPLLLVKVIVARYQKAARGVLTALGTSIFAIAFTLVAINLAVHFLAGAASTQVSSEVSITVIAVALLMSAAGYFTARKPRPATEVKTSPATPTVQRPASAADLLHLTLARVEQQSPDARTLRFLLPPNRTIAARPGQFLTFEWMIDGKPVLRSYTICSSPTQRSFIEITPKRVENGYVSHFLNDKAAVGLTVKARGPYGQFYFEEDKHSQIVLIAAGSGITPMISILRYIDDLCLPTAVTLIYCVRSQHDVFFKRELAALQGRLNEFRNVMVVSQPNSDWSGWKGRLRREILEREVNDAARSTFFLCGPPAFMELARNLLKEKGVDPARILQESFGGGVSIQPSATASTGSLEIKFDRSALAFRISPDETLLQSSEKNGVLIPSGCRQGVCGTCRTRLVSGQVQMESEEALTAELKAQGFVLPCVSRPLADVVLDA